MTVILHLASGAGTTEPSSPCDQDACPSNMAVLGAGNPSLQMLRAQLRGTEGMRVRMGLQSQGKHMREQRRLAKEMAEERGNKEMEESDIRQAQM